MSKERKLIPELRFPEFVQDGEWEEKKLCTCVDYLQPTQFLVSSTAYDNSYKTPVLTAGKTFILGYTNEVDDIFEEKLPVIIFDDFTTASKYVDFPFKAKSSAMKILLSKNDTNIKFTYELMQMIGYEVGVHERHWISIFSKIRVPVPKDKKEQQKIASCLSSLDDLITAHNDKLETLKNHKKGLMQNLFPQEGEKVPKYRFPEFEKDGGWVEKELGVILDFVMGNAFKSIDFVGNGIQLIRMGNLYNNQLQLNRAPIYLPKDFVKEFPQHVVKSGDLLMSMTGTIGKRDYGFVIQVPKNCPDLLLNQRVLKIIPKQNCVRGFILQQLKNDVFLNKLYSIPGGTKQANLSTKDLKKINVSVPPNTKEQQKIASCLSALDDLITAQAEKIEQLQKHKKGLMQGLFPKIVG